ncbi:hypothetical protein [Kordiimonas aquimaris]|uniref:hypothetical protein n=1 Tax=Kordiimonas aquimaris TaxID=707591 RepID=UPI0021CF265A|nr:hypothetical protein [Kordiimonas aquimaris]
MIFISKAYRKVRGALVRIYTVSKAAVGKTISRFFYALFHTRPGLKRGALVLLLFAAVVVPFSVFSGQMLYVSGLWALMLFALFLGMGAERAAIEWSPVFALPPISAFAFWRWHALEKKRFLAVLTALAVGAGCTAIAGIII